MPIDRRTALAAALAAVLPQAPGRCEPTVLKPVQPLVPEPADIFLVRGLFGVFSLGMDTLAERLQVRGYPSTLWGWSDVPLITSNIVAGHRRGDTSHIILIGHSLGADAVIEVAQALRDEAIPVDLVVTFDVTVEIVVPNNVAHYFNFYQYNGFGRSAAVGPGFKGDFHNFDLSNYKQLDHGNIDKAPALQNFVISQVFDVTHEHIQTKKPQRLAAR